MAPPLKALFASYDDALGVLTVVGLLIIFAHQLMAILISKLKWGREGEGLMEMSSYSQEERQELLVQTHSGNLSHTEHLLRWTRFRRNNLENSVVFLPILLLALVGRGYWLEITDIPYPSAIMASLVGYFLVGRFLDTIFILSGRKTWSSYIVTGLNELTVLVSVLGAIGISIYFGSNISSIGDPLLGMVFFSWATVLLLLKLEIIGWNFRKRQRLFERRIYASYDDDGKRVSLQLYEDALRNDVSSLLPFFLISYFWLTILPGQNNTFPRPLLFMILALLFLLSRFVFSFAFLWSRTTLARLSWASAQATLLIMTISFGIIFALETGSHTLGAPYHVLFYAFIGVVVYHAALYSWSQFYSFNPGEDDQSRKTFYYRLRDEDFESLELMALALLIFMTAIEPVIVIDPTQYLVPLTGSLGYASAICFASAIGLRVLQTVLHLAVSGRFVFVSFLFVSAALVAFASLSAVELTLMKLRIAHNTSDHHP